MRFKPIKASEDGWCEWQHPKMKGYMMQCCDCGLVHEVEFRVAKVTNRRKWGWKDSEEAGKDYEVELRMKRV